MTKTYNPLGQCNGKRTYLLKAQAKRAVVKMKASGCSGKLNAYRCPHCGWYHVGKNPAKVARDNAAPTP